jgi:hypothetical protein
MGTSFGRAVVPVVMEITAMSSGRGNSCRAGPALGPGVGGAYAPAGPSGSDRSSSTGIPRRAARQVAAPSTPSRTTTLRARVCTRWASISGAGAVEFTWTHVAQAATASCATAASGPQAPAATATRSVRPMPWPCRASIVWDTWSSRSRKVIGGRLGASTAGWSGMISARCPSWSATVLPPAQLIACTSTSARTPA